MTKSDRQIGDKVSQTSTSKLNLYHDVEAQTFSTTQSTCFNAIQASHPSL